MATNAGIEVTQLRPQAQVRDNYVRPDNTNSGIQQGLARLSGTIDKKQQEEAKARAEELSISESLTSAQDVLDFKAHANESPAVIAHLKELRGSAWASQWRTETEQKYTEWKANSAEDGSDYATFMAERKQQLADVLKGDRFLTAGALGTINETDHNMRLAHRGYLDQRVRIETADTMKVNMQSLVDNMNSGTSINEVATMVDAMVQTTHDVGTMNRTEGNKMMFDSEMGLYKTTLDSRYLLLAKQLRYANNGKGGVGRVDAKIDIEDASNYVEKQLELKETAAYQNAQRERNERLNQGWEELNSLLDGDRNAEVDMGYFTSLGLKSGDILNARKNFQLQDDIPVSQDHILMRDGLIGEISASRYNPRGPSLTRAEVWEKVGTKELHPLHVNEVMKTIEMAEKATPHLQSAAVQRIRGDMIDRLKNSTMVKTPKFGRKVYNLSRGFDAEFLGRVQNWYNTNPGETLSEALVVGMAEQSIISMSTATEHVQQAEEVHETHVQTVDKLAAKSKTDAGFHFPLAWTDLQRHLTLNKKRQQIAEILVKDPTAAVKHNGVVMAAWQALDVEVGKGSFAVWWENNREVSDEE